ncbi:MAG: BA14K family protein [Ahrensia sp.]|nr:BA14K family protein [Ahrensia sp.]
MKLAKLSAIVIGVATLMFSQQPAQAGIGSLLAEPNALLTTPASAGDMVLVGKRGIRRGFRGHHRGFRRGHHRGFHRGYRRNYHGGLRRGYRHHRNRAIIGGLVAGAIIGSALAAPRYYDYQPRRHYRSRGVRLRRAHIDWCYNRFRSYRASDNTFQPFNGPRRACRSPHN